MASTSRIFIGFTIPEVQRTRLGRLQGLIAPDIPNARWVTPEMFHVTLAFLGDVPDTDLKRRLPGGRRGVEGLPALHPQPAIARGLPRPGPPSGGLGRRDRSRARCPF